MSQNATIKQHLRKHGSITSMEAINLYGITRCSGRIYDIRGEGWHINTVPLKPAEFGSPCRYVLISEPGQDTLLGLAA